MHTYKSRDEQEEEAEQKRIPHKNCMLSLSLKANARPST